MKPTKPKTSEKVSEMLSTGKIIDATVARATRKAAREAMPKKSSARSPRPRSNRAA